MKTEHTPTTNCYIYSLYEGRAKSSVTNRLPKFYPRYIFKCFTALEWCVELLTIPVYFVQIAFQLTELFQIELDAVIYTDQFTRYNKKRPNKGWSGVHLLHDNTSSYKCEVHKSFLASEKVELLNHPTYSPDWSPCDFFLFPRLKKMVFGNKYTFRSSLGSAIYQCLQQIPKEDYLSAFRDWGKTVTNMHFSKGGIL